MIYVTGDTHGGIDIAKLKSESFPTNRQLSKDDYVVVAGDFGFVWDGSDKDKYWLEWFRERNFTTLFVDGNHENFDLLNRYPIDIWHGGKAHIINDSVVHLMRGQVFDLDGVKIFTFGGAKSKDIERRKENGSWWEEEMPSEEEYEEGHKSLEKHGWTVDFIISHLCPSIALECINTQCGIKAKQNDLNRYFDRIYERASFKHWYFGHFHADLKLSDKLTLLFNKVEKII